MVRVPFFIYFVRREIEGGPKITYISFTFKAKMLKFGGKTDLLRREQKKINHGKQASTPPSMCT